MTGARTATIDARIGGAVGADPFEATAAERFVGRVRITGGKALRAAERSKLGYPLPVSTRSESDALSMGGPPFSRM